MKVLVVGKGGREHATAWKLAQSPKVDFVFTAPGNAGTSSIKKDGELIGRNVDISAENIEGLANYARKEGIDLTVVGPEKPLVYGIVDEFEKNDLTIFGPDKRAAILEGSKVFSKELMSNYNIPTSHPFVIASNIKESGYLSYRDAKKYINLYWRRPHKFVIKPDGLASGKGVLVPDIKKQAIRDLIKTMVDREFGSTGRVVIEPRLYGRELSYIVLTDGIHTIPLMPGMDYKRLGDGDTGPNTGGMGGRFPEELDENMAREIKSRIMYPTLRAMRNEKRPFKGTLYAGLMITEDGPKVLEYNGRFGDPEQQHQMFMMDPEADIVPYLIACIEGNLSKLPSIKWKDGYCVGVVLASEGYPGKPKTGREIMFSDMSDLDFDYEIFHARTKEEDGKVYTDGGRVLLEVARGKSPEEAHNNVYELIKRTNLEGAYFRTDIGK